jgi:hypothetical protein
MIGPSKLDGEPTTNRAFLGAYRKGQQAQTDGLPISACPYRETRGGKKNNVITYSRAFRRYWQDGWNGKPLV